LKSVDIRLWDKSEGFFLSRSVLSFGLALNRDPVGLQFFLNPLFTWETRMPHYEFFFHECKQYFTKILSLGDYGEGEIACPKCGSTNVELRWSAFSVIASKKSA